MFEMNSRSYRVLTTSLIYLVAIAAALTIATLRSRAKAEARSRARPATRRDSRSDKPFFSLSTHRTYGTTDNARLWVDYQAVDHLDFRVYQVRDPRKFFTGLKDPHQMGERRRSGSGQPLPHRESFLEKVRNLKRWAYAGIQGFVRGQLRRDSRAGLQP